MINNVTNNSITLPNITDSSPIGSTTHQTLNNIVKLHNQSIEFIHLPVELKQKIAFNLDSASYANLRLSAKEMHNALPSFKQMSNDLNHISRGERRDNYLKIHQDLIEQTLSHENESELIQSLNNAFIDKEFNDADRITLHTMYRSTRKTFAAHWNGNVFNRCKDKIIALSNEEIIPTIMIEINQPLFSSLKEYLTTLDIKDKYLTKDNINIIFNAFNKVFNQERSNNRFLVALSAFQLQDFLCNNPPKGVHKKEILEISSHYPFLFSMGMIVSSCVSKNS